MKKQTVWLFIYAAKEFDHGDLIGIMINRSLEMLISVLAVLKSGACYVPVDPSFPQDRIEYMLSNSDAKFLLTSEQLKDKVNFSKKILVELNSSIFNSNKQNLENLNTAQDLAYVIYTSGSTGKPKGVMLTHQNVNNFIVGMSKIVDFSPNKNIVSVTTISFDIFVLESLLPLQKGLTIVLANEDEQNDVKLFNKLCLKHNVNIVQTTPSRFQILISNKDELEYIENITDILVGGEGLPEQLLHNLQSISNANIYNVYGPTETTVWSTVKDVTNSSIITIGKPISNTTCYILDNYKRILPINTPGNLFIGGDGVARGYYKRDDLTNSKFIKNKYTDEIIYDTGDLAYFTKDGELVHLGRSDFQVKVNGHRIELSEIENQILQDTEISNCVVISRFLEENHSCLCAYYITENENYDIKNLRSILQKELPNYMVPQYFVKIDKMPYTPNGKIDRKKLPAPTIKNSREIVSPRNSTDEKIIDMLKSLLNIQEISIEDSFFDIGGDSLSAIELCSKIDTEFNVQLHIKDIFESPSIREISDLIISKKDSKKELIPIAKKMGSYPASYAQSRIYFATQLSGDDSILYNITGGLIFSSLPDLEKLEAAFKNIIKNQPSFRTFFKLENNSVMQIIKDSVSFKLEKAEKVLPVTEIENAFKEFNTAFNLNEAPLLKAKVLPLDDNRYLLMVSTHHIVCDGTSLNVLLENLGDLYQGKSIIAPNVDYKDYSVWEKEQFEAGKMFEAENYWIDKLSDCPPSLDLKSKSRSTLSVFAGSKVLSGLDAKKVTKINNKCKSLGITPYMFLLSAYYILLYKYTMQNDIVVGTPIINRSNDQLSHLIGMFVNTLPIRAYLKRDITFSDFVSQVKLSCLEAYRYQNYPFDQLVKKLNINRNTGKNPLFNTSFVYQSKYNIPEFAPLTAQYYIPETTTSKFDLSLEVIPTDSGLDFSFEYSTKLFDSDFISCLAQHYCNIIDVLLRNSNIKIENISMLSQDDVANIYEYYQLPYPKDKSVSELFEEQVVKAPNNIALSMGTENLTYNNLNKRANRFANYLIKNGVKTGDIVAVLLNRSIDLIVSMLSLNKIGAAYLPLSTEYPIDRILYILDHSKCKLIVSNSSDSNILSGNTDLDIIKIDTVNDPQLSSNNLGTKVSPDDILYVLYTSGSTGNPKGVMVTNNNLNNFIHSFNDLYKGISSNDKLLASTNICFDVSIFEFYISLLNGAQLHLYDENIINDIFHYCDSIIKNNISMLYIPPNILEEVYKILSNAKYHELTKLLIGVEPIKTRIIEQYYNINPEMIIVNGYGPTETTICTTALVIENSESLTNNRYDIIPIGKPIHNSHLIVLDNDLNPVPLNVPGELYVCGENVSRGYINDKKQTDNAYIQYKGNTFYKTGDIVVLDKNGNYNFIGRNDSQIKINGHRVELGEIEKNMYLYPDIIKAVILVNSQNKIVAYFTSSSKVNVNDLRLFLQTKMPLYYIPNFFVQVDKFVLTANGKVDRKWLLKLKINTSSDYEPPSTEDEKKLVKLFESILNIRKVGINDNFFDLGGDSLSAIKLQIEAFNQGFNISYKDIFELPTIKQLAKSVSHKRFAETVGSYDYSKIEEFLNKDISIKKIQKAKFKNILLTGVTGFVGCHILDYLLKHTSCKVYCLVRLGSSSDIYTKVMDTIHFYFGDKYDKLVYKRIFILQGDITKNYLGISNSYINALGKSIDCVINSAAVVRHYGKNSIFTETNIAGVQNLIEFCLKYNCKLVHISTLSVSGSMFEGDQLNFSNCPAGSSFTEQNLFINQDLSNVYVATKFFGERLILENIIQNNLDAKILRLGNITNRYSDGKFQINITENAFLNRIKSFLKIGAVPDYITNGYVEFTPVDYCAEAVVKIALSTNDLSVFHVYNNNHITFSDLISLFRKYGISIDVLSETQFKERLDEILKKDKANLSGIINDFDDNKKLSYTSQIKISNDITNRFLKKLFFKWPKIDNKYIKRYVSYLKSIHFLDNEE